MSPSLDWENNANIILSSFENANLFYSTDNCTEVQLFARIKIDNNKCDPLFVVSFLRSEYGQIQIYKWINGSTNLLLSTNALEEIYIPITKDYNNQAKKIAQARNMIRMFKIKISDLWSEEEYYFHKIISNK